jgi:serine/threonine-protein kinase
VALGSLLGAAVIIALFLAAMDRRGAASIDHAAHDDTAGAHADHESDTATDAVIAAAQANLDRGDFATAIDSLTAVEKKRPDRVDVHMLLERAYTGIRDGKDAVREAGLVLAVDPSGQVDLKLQEDVRNAALVKETQEDAFTLLESKMGTRGIDILYDVAFGTAGRMYPQAAVRARRSLENADVRGRCSPALAILLDFRDAKTCEDRHALLDRARDQGDTRLASALKPYESTRGCGFLSRSDCYPCMHKDHSLADAIAGIQARAPH